jgi:hypothetical protein
VSSSIDPASASLALKARIIAAAAAAPSPTRDQGRRATRLVLAASIAAGIAFFELAGGLAHAGDRPPVLTVRLADGWALASAALTWLTVRFGTPLVRSAEILRAACIAAPGALVLWIAHFHGAYLDPPAGAPWACIVTSLACASFPLAGMLWVRRESEARHPGTLGAAIGSACGAWAGVLALLRCPETGPLHALLAHALPLVVTTLAGALAGARVLAIGAYRPLGRRRPRMRAPRSAPSPASTTIGRM